jgi:hypothetical protein
MLPILHKDYGTLQPLIDSYLWVIGLGSALYLRWGPGLSKWQPPIEGTNRVVGNIGVFMSGAFAVILWVTCAQCAAVPGLVATSLVCVLLVIAGLSGYIIFRRSRLYYPLRGKHAGSVVVGGSELTPAAQELRWEYCADGRIEVKAPTQILEELGNPDLVWTRESRSRSEIALLWTYLVWTVAGTVGLTALALALHLRSDLDQRFQPLTVSPGTVDMWPGGRQLFRGRVSNCSCAISWSVEGAETGHPRAEIGNIGNASGIYSAPTIIGQDQLVKVVATSEGARAEATITLHHGKPLLFDEQISMTGEDDREGLGLYILNVIDHKHSWEYTQDNALIGSITGPDVINQLAKSQAFSGYDAIISVGTASREFRREADECYRAGRRALRLASWIEESSSSHASPQRSRGTLHPVPEIWLLNLQRFHPSDRVVLRPDETAKERPLI